MPSGDYWWRECEELEKENEGLKRMLLHAMIVLTTQWSEQHPNITEEMREWYDENRT